jgi:hypothetical protein
MVSLSLASSSLLLNKKEDGASHSIEKSGAASAFSHYGYGPLDLPDADKEVTADGSGAKPVSGTSSISAISGAGGAQFLAHMVASMNPIR